MSAIYTIIFINSFCYDVVRRWSYIFGVYPLTSFERTRDDGYTYCDLCRLILCVFHIKAASYVLMCDGE